MSDPAAVEQYFIGSVRRYEAQITKPTADYLITTYQSGEPDVAFDGLIAALVDLGYSEETLMQGPLGQLRQMLDAASGAEAAGGPQSDANSDEGATYAPEPPGPWRLWREPPFPQSPENDPETRAKMGVQPPPIVAPSEQPNQPTPAATNPEIQQPTAPQPNAGAAQPFPAPAPGQAIVIQPQQGQTQAQPGAPHPTDQTAAFTDEEGTLHIH
jgi:hypothetical protein